MYPKNTPWGQTQHAEKLARGIYMLTTAGHGGIYLDGSRQLEIGKRSKWLDSAAFWEEDCDWAVPVAFFKSAILRHNPDMEKSIKAAENQIKNDPEYYS